MREGQKIALVARYIGSSIKRGRLGTSIAALETTVSKRPFTFNRSLAETKSPPEHRLRSARTPLLIKPAHECLRLTAGLPRRCLSRFLPRIGRPAERGRVAEGFRTGSPECPANATRKLPPRCRCSAAWGSYRGGLTSRRCPICGCNLARAAELCRILKAQRHSAGRSETAKNITVIRGTIGGGFGRANAKRSRRTCYDAATARPTFCLTLR